MSSFLRAFVKTVQTIAIRYLEKYFYEDHFKHPKACKDDKR